MTLRALRPRWENASINSLSCPGAFLLVFLMTVMSSCISKGCKTSGVWAREVSGSVEESSAVAEGWRGSLVEI